NAATPSLEVAEFQGTAALTVFGGTLNTVNTTIGAASGGNGTIKVGTNGNWTNSGQLAVGGQGAGTLTIQDQGLAYVGTNLSIGSLGIVNLNGGTLRFNGYSRSGTINFAAGTVKLAGSRTIGTDTPIQDFF